MANEPSSVKWYIVFDMLAKALVDHYNKYIDGEASPGEKLYEILLENSSFKQHHTWIRKFDKEFGVKSIDPIHVFASFNSGSAPSKNRTIRLRDIVDALNIKVNFAEINYDGCPAPQIINLVSVRTKEEQSQIWDFFFRIYGNGNNGLKESDFVAYKSWYGLELASITIFLFWIRSDCFLPLDTYTRTFVVSTRIVEYAPNDFHDYMALIDRIDLLNRFYADVRYEERGIFRELTYLAYSTISKGAKDMLFSNEVNELLKTAKRSPSQSGNPLRIDEVVVENSPKQKILEASVLAELGFKIIAVKALTECDESHLNNIKRNTFYHFEKTIIVTETETKYNQDKAISLYDLNAGRLKVNVSAVVGKNGSGKSSLIELLFRIINNIAYKHKDDLNTEDIIHVPGIHAEFYYVLSGQLLCLHVRDENIQIQEYTLDSSEFKKHGNLRDFAIEDFGKWFYTIAVNYSLYALNSDHLDNWIEKLFHKNDSYQTPLVINPMRTRGNININTENELVKYRLLANLFSLNVDGEDDGIRQITKKQKAVEVEFELNKEKTKILFYKYDTGREVAVPYENLNTDEQLLIEPIQRIFSISFDIADFPQHLNISQDALNETKRYIIRKLVKIAVTYSQYVDYFDRNTLRFEMAKFETYLQTLLDRKSHITYKLMQAVNCLKHPDLFPLEDKFTLSIKGDGERLWNYLSTINDTDLNDIDIIEFLPPPIFKPKIILVNDAGKTSDFQSLSSGEKQLIHTVNSILYHINNIDSVKSKNGDLIKYRNINLLLDEIELYYHPELQREYLAYLLRMIERLPLVNIDAINICFVTHSPFILSDIPTDFTLRLKDGSPDPAGTFDQTFGANIHDLLANDFFMEEGFMGNWAKEKINETISHLNYLKLKNELAEIKTEDPELYRIKKKELERLKILHDKNTIDYHKRLIANIGEPILRKKLAQMYDAVTMENTELELIENKIAELQKQEKELKKKRK